jgi:erythromycin esterase-like protein
MAEDATPLPDFDVPAFGRLLERSADRRGIGVIYGPESVWVSHDAQAARSRQYDGWVWFDETRAVQPLGPEHARPGMPEIWPSGL